MRLNFRRGSAFANKKAKKYLKNKKPEDIKSVAVIRHAAIGDFVVMRPFLIELKVFFPNAKITLSVDRNAMYGMPKDLVDEVHIIDKVFVDNKSKKTGMFSRLKQIRELPKQDILFDLTDSSLTLLMAIFAKVDIKVGYSYRAFRRLFYDLSVLRSDFVLESQSMLHQLNILGANTKHYPLEYGLTKESRDIKNPYIIYFAGASIQARCWGEENFVMLIEKMRNKYSDYQHIVLKGIKEDEQFDDIYAPFADYENVVHQNTLPLEGIYDYLAKSSLVIVGDTGIRNMAIASNTPTLGLMWAMGISPLRYLPKVKEHQVVFNSDYLKPSVDEVLNSTIQLMDGLYESNDEKN
ncbi:glycosyltransferase family 9 protein [Candidatus Sulfurimonas marisnigri]|uniref:Glycosyltransferase family 9 protein n=1 Tax=Candidatus Sulfurimonas marisnigri TaxID=2740405 RepID=A0A7S7RR21_9BACT|nr:glycosyltransferase family 9 protein [Candidatus Sulfurimonas marisnigri]QOY55229.1 glycosyltransferase family 9 protein [Candidatus Sulfurimonas marisnigri]